MLSQRYSKRMRFGVEDKFIQTDDVMVTENKVEVFERFGQPKALHTVILFWWRIHNIPKGCVAKLCPRMSLNCLEHVPCHILIFDFARQSEHVKD